MNKPTLNIEITRPDRAPETVLINKLPYAIGSDSSADLRLDAPGILPRHAQVVRLGGTYHLLPDPAAVPLALDGAPVSETGVVITHGASVTLGHRGELRLRFLDGRVGAQDREERLITLMEIARTITDSLNIDEVLERVLDGAVRFSGAQRGYLFLRDGERLVPWTRGSAAPDGVEVSLSVVEQVARTGRPAYRDNLRDGDGGSTTRSIVRLRLQAVLCLPLAVRQDVIGVVYLDSRRVLPYHEPDLPLLEALAGLAAIAIQNSRLVEERVRAERSLAIGQMAGAIVHDLRSPLASIQCLAELLLHRSGENDPSRHHLETMISEVDRLTSLTTDLLQFSRKSPPLERVEVALADLVCDTLKPFKARLQRVRVGLNLVLDEDTRAAVDAPRMVRVLNNLISNGIDAMAQGGSLTIRCGGRSGWSIVAVRDTGCGMSPEVQRRIFEPFFSDGKRHGTGLGMAIVRSIVDEHQGKIEVESAPGQGTTVTIFLPAVAGSQEGITTH